MGGELSNARSNPAFLGRESVGVERNLGPLLFLLSRSRSTIFMGLQNITKEYLEQNRLRPHSGGWMITCPACLGNDCWETYEINGRVSCFNCGTNFRISGYDYNSGFEKELIEADINGIRDLYQSAVDLYHSCLGEEQVTYLTRRGIDLDAIHKFRIGYCPRSALALYHHPLTRDAGIADRQGNPALGNRITFGYIADGRITDVRGRSYLGEEPKYKSLYHSSAFRGALYPFNWDEACKKANELGYLIITEGEIKAVVADLQGFPCVALPGMVSWKPYLTPNPAWKVYIIYDSVSDRIGKLQVNKAIDRLVSRIPSAYIGTLPLEGRDKQDIDSFLIEGKGDRVERFKHVLEQAVPHEKYLKLTRI